MRQRAFGDEHPGSLLSADAVARTSLDMLLSPLTGQVVDIRLDASAGPLVPAPARAAEPSAVRA
jgi:2-C-methyl-D-erythritol 4-phosphate cytidylyltransferase